VRRETFCLLFGFSFNLGLFWVAHFAGVFTVAVMDGEFHGVFAGLWKHL
jgi:hypothetical protein